jgi:hypothetical protein
VLVSDRFEAKLADFGNSVLALNGPLTWPLTQFVRTTWIYASPEVLAMTERSKLVYNTHF